MNFQTLGEFMSSPFGNKNTKKIDDYENAYKRIQKSSSFKINGYTQIDDEYLLHIKVPSESNKGQIYDVVVLFFTDNNTVKKENTIRNYYIKFFSNSPAFIYKYATLYKINGFLIESLYDKMDKNYSDTMPDKANKNYDMFCDKTIYCACKLLMENQFTALSKFGIIVHHKKNTSKFFSDIAEFATSKFGTDMKNIDKNIDKEVEKTKREIKSTDKKNTSSSNGKKPKKTASKSTIKNGNSGISKSKKIIGNMKKSKITKSKSVGRKK